MGKVTIDFSHRVLGDFSPNGLQKVFISFHPSDIVKMDGVASDILAIANCAVYYHKDSFSMEDIDLEDYGLKLQEMKLFVVIVSTNYLSNDSLSKSWEYDFAIKHNIPLLPIAVESGLEEFFAIEMNRIESGYGDIQLLKSQDTDKTEIPYKQKLLRDLGAILVNDNEIERVKNAFSGQIFLSYRKKDRKFANELMRTIHSISSLQSVSIWYDEFISSGEKWSDQIENALKNSDIFLLMVSPFISEPDNYVIKEEYPAAQKRNKKIVSARKTKKQSEIPSQNELEHLFPGLRVFIDGDNAAELEDALQELKDNGENNPEKDYLIGLAFFNGIGVERNSEKAVSLIIASAQKNLPEAINKLAEMYWTGDGIATNYENSVLWRKKLVEIFENQSINIENHDKALSYIKALESLVCCLYELSAYRDSLSYGKKLVSFIEQTVSDFQPSEISHYQAQAYDLCGKNSRRLGLYDDAIIYAQKYCDVSIERYETESTLTNLHNLSVAYGRIGDAYYAVGDLKQAETWYLRSWEIDIRVNEELQSVDSAYGLSASALVLGDIHMRNREYEKADQYYIQAADLRKKILDADSSDKFQKAYGEAILARGTSLLLKGDIKKANTLFTEAKDIMTTLAEEYGTIESQHACSVALNRCGKTSEMEGNFEQALAYYSDGLARREKILTRIRTAEVVYEYALNLYFIAGIHQHLYDNTSAKKKYDEVVENLLPILSKDRKGDWHRIFAEASFEWFKLDTFAGKRYLQYAIDAWKWLYEKQPENNYYQKQYKLCQKMYSRCYPN